MTYVVSFCHTDRCNNHVFDYVEFSTLSQSEAYEQQLKSFIDSSEDEWTLTWSMIDGPEFAQ